MTSSKQREILETLYTKLNRREFVTPDPLQFLYNYEELRDREIVGIIASSLAIGNVKAINASVAHTLERIGKPYEFVMNSEKSAIGNALCGLKHRWTTCEEMTSLLCGLKRTIADFGSLNKAFLSNTKPNDKTTFETLDSFGALIGRNSGMEFEGLKPTTKGSYPPNRLITIPARGSSSKRWHLFLRWMIRKDDVDPGGWKGIPKAKLVVPMDTHMSKLAQELGFSTRTVVNRNCALEVTRAFAEICPEDPVKYDFSLTRLGIRNEMSFNEFLNEWRSIPETPFEKAFKATV